MLLKNRRGSVHFNIDKCRGLSDTIRPSLVNTPKELDRIFQANPSVKEGSGSTNRLEYST